MKHCPSHPPSLRGHHSLTGLPLTMTLRPLGAGLAILPLTTRVPLPRGPAPPPQPGHAALPPQPPCPPVQDDTGTFRLNYYP